MKAISKNIWNTWRGGLRGVLHWWLIVLAAGFLFGTLASVCTYVGAPWALYLWNDHLPLYVAQTPVLVATVDGTMLMTGFIMAVALAFVFYRGLATILIRQIPNAEMQVA